LIFHLAVHAYRPILANFCSAFVAYIFAAYIFVAYINVAKQRKQGAVGQTRLFIFTTYWNGLKHKHTWLVKKQYQNQSNI